MKISVNNVSQTKSIKTKSTFDDAFDADQKYIEVDKIYEQQTPNNLQITTSHIFKNYENIISPKSSAVSDRKIYMKQIQNDFKNNNQQSKMGKYQGDKKQIRFSQEEDKIINQAQNYRMLGKNEKNDMESYFHKTQKKTKNAISNNFKSSHFLSPHLLKKTISSENSICNITNDRQRKNSQDQNFINLLNSGKDLQQISFNGRQIQKQTVKKVKSSKLESKQSQVLQRCVSYDGGLKIVQNKKIQKKITVQNQEAIYKQTRMKLKDYLYMCKSSTKLNSKAHKRANSPKYQKQIQTVPSSHRKQQKYKITNLGMFKIIKDQIFNDLYMMEQRLGKIKSFMQQMVENDYELSDQQLLVMYNLRNDIKEKIANRVTQSLQLICRDRKLNQLRKSFIQNSFRMDESRMMEKEEEEGDYFCII